MLTPLSTINERVLNLLNQHPEVIFVGINYNHDKIYHSNRSAVLKFKII